ncbi:MAG: hypothetical protein QMD82_07115 [bacterium]|nr:hypothetical protein [bacterium]
MNIKHRLALYLTSLLILYVGTIYITKLKIEKTQQEIGEIKSAIKNSYNKLTDLMSSSIYQILALPQKDTVEIILKARAHLFLSSTDPFNSLVEENNYELALYYMNKKSTLFFEIVNYAWEFVPNLRNTRAITDVLEVIGDVELTVDSLLTKAKILYQTENFYRKIYNFLWPFSSLKKTKNSKPANPTQKINVSNVPTSSKSFLFLILELLAFETAST